MYENQIKVGSLDIDKEEEDIMMNINDFESMKKHERSQTQSISQ